MNVSLLSIAAAALACLPLLAPSEAQDSRPAATPPRAETAPALPVTVIAVRHAEKGTDDPRDPQLSDAGKARADALASLLAKAGVTHIFSTPYERTRGTVAPLAAALKLEVSTYSPADMSAFAETLRGLPAGSVAVVSGHSNTTPALVLDLGGDIEDLRTYRGGPALAESEYDRLFVVTLGSQDHATKTIELRYGE